MAGHRHLASLAFVAGANPVLFLEPGRDAAEPTISNMRFALFLGDPPLILVAFVGLAFAGYEMTKAIRRALEDRCASVLEHPEVVWTIRPVIWARRAAMELS